MESSLLESKEPTDKDDQSIEDKQPNSSSDLIVEHTVADSLQHSQTFKNNHSGDVKNPEVVSSNVSSSGATGITSECTLNLPKSSKTTEINAYLDKLRDMVPYAKNSPKLSKVQLIHCAIDYITDLQESLEARVKSENYSATLLNRSPLADLSSSGQTNNPNNTSAESQSSRIREVQPQASGASPTEPRLFGPGPSGGSNLVDKQKEPINTLQMINEYFISKVIQGDILISEQTSKVVNKREADSESASNCEPLQVPEDKCGRSHENTLENSSIFAKSEASSSRDNSSSVKEMKGKTIKKIKKDDS